MKRIFSLLVISGILCLSNTSYSQTSLDTNFILSETDVFYDSYNDLLKDYDIEECSCETQGSGDIDCKKIAKTVRALLEIWTDMDNEKLEKVETAIEAICEIFKE